MLSQPLTLNKSDVRGRGLPVVAPPPYHLLADDVRTQTGAPPSSSSSSSAPLHPSSSSSSAPLHPSSSSSSAPLHPSSSSSSTSLLPSSSSSSSSLHPSCSSSSPFHPHSSSSSLHPHSSSSPLHPHSSSSPLHPHSSSSPLHPHSSSSSLHLHSSSSPLHPHSSSSSLHPHSSSSPPHLHCSSLLSPSAFSNSSPCAPLTPCPPPLPPLPPPPPACCPCSALLPRLLSAHRMEVRRLLRGALASLGRRLDSLERSRSRRTKRRWRGGQTAPPAPPAVPVCSSSSSSSSDRLEPSGGRGVQEGEGRFVGRMAVSFRGGAEEEEEHLLTLHTFIQPGPGGQEAGGGESQWKESGSIAMTTNGYTLRSFSQHALQLHHSQPNGQSDASTLPTGQWCFSKRLRPFSVSSNPSISRMWLGTGWSFSPAPMLRLSAVAIETMMEAVRGGAYSHPLRPLRDWTAPPSLSADHCYIRTVKLSPPFSARRQQRRRANHGARVSNRLCAPPPPDVQSGGEQRKRVSQIRIRRVSPREPPLTPMGLPKVKRLKKKEFSLEEIYTNKNYKSTNSRSLETIFEEPREKDGSLLLIGQQKRRRLLLFPDFTQPRKRKRPPGAGLAVAMAPRKRAARRHGGRHHDDVDLDVMLVERLSELQHFLVTRGLDT